MTASPSKLLVQLNTENKIPNKHLFNEENIEEIYTIICKLEPKNLNLIEFLILVIEKDFIKNSFKLIQLVELYEQIKGKNLQQDYNYNKNNVEIEEQKFNKKKFIKLLKEMSKKMYPGYSNAYETIIFDKLTRSQSEDHKMKIDDSIKKILSKQTIMTLNEFDRELQAIFQLYMPENYNLGLNFNWEEIKILQKKLPIICFFKFLYEIEVVPTYITPIQFLQIISKIKPPSIPNSNSSKEAMFYTSETFAVYMRDFVHLSHIKLLQGDIGLTYLQFQIFFAKIATEFCKDVKNDFSSNIRKLAAYTNLKEAFEDNGIKKSRFMELVKNYIKYQNSKSDKVMMKKRESRKKIEDLYDAKDLEMKQQSKKNEFKNMSISRNEIEGIKRQLDGQLPQTITKKKLQKQNQGYFDVEKKHIVIGQQLPKIPQKNKQNAPKDIKKKNQDTLMGYRPQTLAVPQESETRKIVRRPKKLRMNNQYPIILNEVFYPSDLKSQLFISPSAQLYLQTSYIHLGEKLYQQAYENYLKAKEVKQSKSTITQFYYNIHAAQIFESAGKDEIALSFYHKAKQLIAILTSIDNSIKSFPYIGLGCVLYHMEQYDYALRCYEKARNLNGINFELESLENAILQNNIGCCLMMLNRNQEAIKYFRISHDILDLKVGCFDERTLVVQQNLNKNKKAYLQMLPQFKTMWKTYVQKSSNKLPVLKSGQKLKK